jgi:dynein heavy chain, axonemal
MLTLMDNIQKCLNIYLNSKRQLYPRFYFIADDELLSIVGSSDPLNIQVYLPKMFENISTLNFLRHEQTETNDTHDDSIHLHARIHAIGMFSFEHEHMLFVNSVECYGKVEQWMLNIEQEMKRSNRSITKEATFYYRYKQSRLQWMKIYVGMVVLAVSQLWSTWEIEEYVLNSHDRSNVLSIVLLSSQFVKINKYQQRSAMKVYVKQLNSQIEEIIVEMREPLTNSMFHC